MDRPGEEKKRNGGGDAAMCCCVSNLLRNRAGAAVEKKTMLQLTESRAKRSQFCRFLSSSWETDREPSPSARVALQRTLLGVCLFLSFFYFVINIFGGLLSLSGNHLHGNPSPSAGICETKKKCATEYYYHRAIHFQKAD